MPKLLVARFRDDSIQQFRRSAELRNQDALALAGAGRGAAAVYLWGYVAEMTLKAAWFSSVGHAATQVITKKDLNQAADEAKKLQVLGFSLHDVFGWASFLIQHRASSGSLWANAGLPNELIMHANRIKQRWDVVLRYKQNTPYAHEVECVRASADWFLRHSTVL